MPHSGLKPKNNEPKEEGDLRCKRTFDGENLWKKTTFMGVNLWRKTTFDRSRPLKKDDLWQKTTFDRLYSIVPEKNLYNLTATAELIPNRKSYQLS